MKSAPPRNQTVEVVEDSEPEREETRKRRKEERQRRKEKRKAESLIVIELTDSDSQSPIRVCGSRKMKRPTGLNQITRVEEPAFILRDIVPTPSSSSKSRRNSDIPASGTTTASASVPRVDPTMVDATIGSAAETAVPGSQSLESVTSTDVECTGSNDEMEERSYRMRAKLGSFSFSTISQASSTKTGSFLTVRERVNTTEAPKRTGTHDQGSVKAKILYLDFSERQLNSLLKCVSCDLKWTTRKTAGHKAAHMRACAKKTHLTEETMKVLISRHADSQSTAKALDTKKQAQEPPPKTFLEHVVNENDIQRPGKRRREVSSSVRAAIESRGDILDRARTILDRSSSSWIPLDEHGTMKLSSTSHLFGQSRLATQLMSISSYSDPDLEPPCTQALPRSGLGTALSNGRMDSCALDLMAERPSLDSPPATQLLGTSNLSSMRRIGPSLFSSGSLMEAVSPSDSPLLKMTRNPPKSKDISQSSHTFRHKLEDDTNTYDNAILVFDPEMQEKCTSSVQTKIFGEKCSEISSKHDHDQDAHPGFNEVETDTREAEHGTNDKSITDRALTGETTKATSSRKRNVKQNGGKHADEDPDSLVVNDEELFAKFNTMVLEDETLYLRVLRYEPIRFDVFLDMALEHVKKYNIRPLPLKIKLRTFLDKQAIHYYGSEPGGWNR